MPALKCIFSGPITNLLSILCVLMKILSHANAKKKKKKKKKRAQDFKFCPLNVLINSSTVAIVRFGALRE